MSARRAFTLLDLLFLLIIGIFLLGQFFALQKHSGESATRIRCAGNLRQIGQAMLIYANENKGVYPRTRWDPDHSYPVQYTRPDAVDPFASEGPYPNDITAALFLLIRTEELNSRVFICPNTTLRPWDYDHLGASPLKFSNFTGGEHLSYSLANPYPDQAAVDRGFHWDKNLSAGFAVAADMNPGTSELLQKPNQSTEITRLTNTKNHQQDGQNVFFGDGHAEFVVTPFVGANHDNIYTYGPSYPTIGGSGIIGPPADANDSVLLPVMTVDPMKFTPLLRFTQRGLTFIAITILVVLWIIIRSILSYRRSRSSSNYGTS